MEKQCAGCGTVFEDGNEPKGVVTPRPYGCCPDCNKTQFRTHPHNEVKAPKPVVVGEPARHPDSELPPVSEDVATQQGPAADNPSEPHNNALDSVKTVH